MDFEKLIKPDSIAIIGASEHPAKIGYQIVNNIKNAGFEGQIYPINNKGGRVLDMPMTRSIMEIDSAIDLAIIVIPSIFVAKTVKECAEKSVKAIIIISAGFAEQGEKGAGMQEEVSRICRENNILMLGPNCLGLINTEISLNASFANTTPNHGNVSLISQSGAIISSMIDWSLANNIGFSKIFSMGNAAVIQEKDVYEYLYNDDSTKVIVAYLEKLDVNDELTKTFIKYSAKKPTIILFGGKSDFGSKAAASHTGSIVSSYVSIETYLKQAGIVVAENLEDLFAYTQIFSRYQSIGGKKIGIVTNAGGPSIATCDSISAEGMKLAELSSDTTEFLEGKLRESASLRNPVDILGDGTELEYEAAIKGVLEDPGVDGMIIILTPQSSTKVEAIANAIASIHADKPVVSVFIGGKSVSESAVKIREAGRICFDFPEQAVKALSALAAFTETKNSLLVPVESKFTYDNSAKNDLLQKYSLPVLSYLTCYTSKEAVHAADKIGYPVVMKTGNKEIIHKSDAGGIALNLANQESVEKAFSDIGSPAIVGKMVKTKYEIFLGIKKDQHVGTVIAFGTGGIYAETFNDFSYRISPISPETAMEMILETKMGQILSGLRGQRGVDLQKLSQIIINTARFADDHLNISEIDFNPVIADADNFYIVDARIIES